MQHALPGVNLLTQSSVEEAGNWPLTIYILSPVLGNFMDLAWSILTNIPKGRGDTDFPIL